MIDFDLYRLHEGNLDMGMVNYDLRSALHLAAAEGHLEVVTFLVETCNLDRDMRDRYEQNIMIDEISYCFYDTISIFCSVCLPSPLHLVRIQHN